MIQFYFYVFHKVGVPFGAGLMEDWVEPCQGAVREACLLMDIGRLLSRK